MGRASWCEGRKSGSVLKKEPACAGYPKEGKFLSYESGDSKQKQVACYVSTRVPMALEAEQSYLLPAYSRTFLCLESIIPKLLAFFAAKGVDSLKKAISWAIL